MEFKLDFELNLQHITTVRIATLLLDHPSVTLRLQDVFLYQMRSQRNINEFDDSVVPRITMLPLQHLDICSLPSVLLNEVYFATQSMGLKMFHWYIRVCRSFKFDEEKTISCIKKICWTYYGSIDYKRTYELCWLGNPKLSSMDLCAMPFHYCFLDHLKQYLCEPLDQNNCELTFWGALFDDIMVNGEISTCTRKHCYAVGGTRGVYRSRIVDRLLAATSSGNCDAVKYRWSRLSDTQKRYHIVRVTDEVTQNLSQWNPDGFADTCVFLLNQMTSEDLAYLIECKSRDNMSLWIFNVISTFLVLWPWDRLIVPILKKLWKFPLLWDSSKGLLLTNLMIDIITYDYLWKMDPRRWNVLLRHIWFAVPTHIKLLCPVQSFAQLVITLLQREQIELIQMILYDADITSMREQLATHVIQQCISMDSGMQFHQIDTFLSVASNSAEEKKALKMNLSIWGSLRINFNIGRLNEFLRWQCDSDEEYACVKAKMDVTKIWSDLLQWWGLNSANIFLEWYFECNKENIKIFKEHLTKTAHPCDFIFECWCNTNLTTCNAADVSTNFLYWLFDNVNAIINFVRMNLTGKGSRIADNCTDNIHKHLRVEQFEEWCNHMCNKAYNRL